MKALRIIHWTKSIEDEIGSDGIEGERVMKADTWSNTEELVFVSADESRVNIHVLLYLTEDRWEVSQRGEVHRLNKVPPVIQEAALALAKQFITLPIEQKLETIKDDWATLQQEIAAIRAETTDFF